MSEWRTSARVLGFCRRIVFRRRRSSPAVARSADNSEKTRLFRETALENALQSADQLKEIYLGLPTAAFRTLKNTHSSDDEASARIQLAILAIRACRAASSVFAGDAAQMIALIVNDDNAVPTASDFTFRRDIRLDEIYP